MNNTDNGGFTAEQYYPGDAYVDWVAIDGYNFGTSQTWSSWISPAQVFDNMRGRLRALASAKPLALTEFGTTTANLGVAGKSQWITDVFSYVQANGIKMVVYFNTDKETDWAVYGGVAGDETINRIKAYSAYRNAISNAAFVTSDPSNVRLLTEGQFSGQ